MLTVLIVEDSLTDTEILTHYLKQVGLMVLSVTSYEEAKVTLEAKKPDLVFLDVILPGQSGFELCRDLKTNAHTKNIPVVICSTKSTDVDKLWGSMLGADAYLPKPIDQQELTTTILRLTATQEQGVW